MEDSKVKMQVLPVMNNAKNYLLTQSEEGIKQILADNLIIDYNGRTCVVIFVVGDLYCLKSYEASKEDVVKKDLKFIRCLYQYEYDNLANDIGCDCSIYRKQDVIQSLLNNAI